MFKFAKATMLSIIRPVASWKCSTILFATFSQFSARMFPIAFQHFSPFCLAPGSFSRPDWIYLRFHFAVFAGTRTFSVNTWTPLPGHVSMACFALYAYFLHLLWPNMTTRGRGFFWLAAPPNVCSSRLATCVLRELAPLCWRRVFTFT